MNVKQQIWAVVATMVVALSTAMVAAQPAEAPAHTPGGEANLVLPDLGSVTFLGGSTGTRCCCPAWSSACWACCSA